METTVGESTVIEEDVTLFEQSVIADRCRIGKNTVIKQNGKVWPYKVIDSHSIIASSGITERENTSGWLQKVV